MGAKSRRIIAYQIEKDSPLCHWPCSCYPNYGSGQTQDWMNYWAPYATSHQALDADQAVQEEVRNAARSLFDAVTAKREGRFVNAGVRLKQPRQK